MMSCKEATLLASKKEEGKLSLAERLKLAIHYVMCVYCKRFEQHTKIISRKAKEVSTELKMSETAKNDIKKALKSA